jgi:hypothetical protein
MAAEIRVDRITSRAGINTSSLVGAGVTISDLYVKNLFQDGAPVLAGAGGTWQANLVGIYTGKIIGVNTTTIAGSARSEGAIQAYGNIAVIDGILLTDQTIDGEITIPAGRNGLLVGPVAISVGSTVTVQAGSTLVVV